MQGYSGISENKEKNPRTMKLKQLLPKAAIRGIASSGATMPAAKTKKK
jgi:hypothetical protein